MTQSTEDTARTACIDGLRALADALEADATLPLPYHGHSVAMSFFTDDKAELVALARLMTGRAEKKVDDSGSYGFKLEGQVYGLKLLAYAHRDEVCERVVTGTREVTRTEQITEVTGTREVTETVEDVEWICRPLLAAEVSA